MLHKKRKPSTFTLSSGNYEDHIASSKTKLHSKSAYFYRWLPISCSLALLLGLGIILNPAIDSTEDAHAETVAASPTDYSSISLTISNNGTELNTGDTVSTNVEPGLVSYITNNLRIDTKKINRFYVSIQAAEDGTSELTGTNNHATIAPVGSNKIPTATDENGFSDNTWGFALGDSTTANESMSYNSLPAYGASTTPQYSSATNLADGTYNLKLTFAAKINADKPSDHYTTKAMVSVAADVKAIPEFTSLGNITKMSEMTSAYCKSLPTPYATAELKDVPTGQLIDEREGENGTKYWVSKLADGNCWMTQNMMYGTGAKNTAYKNRLVDPSKTAFDEIGTKTPSDDPLSTAVYPSEDTYNAHYQIGNYYTFTDADAVCTSLGGNWDLPTGNTSGQFQNLIATQYKIANSADGLTKVKAAPLYFVAGGYTGSSVGGVGGYWSSTNGNGRYYALYFYNNSVNPSSGHVDRSDGFSIRCVVSGA